MEPAHRPLMLYEIDNLSFAYSGAPVLADVTLGIGTGEFVSLIGPNGAGKSTLLKLMVGLLDGFQGALRFEARSVPDYRPEELARKVAFVPQETHVVFPFTAAEMMLMGRQAWRKRGIFDTHDDAIAVREAMLRTETAHLASRTFNELSGGERQRVVLASALVQQPEVLLLDEPTVYLDLKHQIDFYQMLAELNLDGMTIVAATHDLNLAARYAHRMIVLHDSRIRKDGTPDDVLTPQLLEDVFEIRAHILTRPEGGTYVIPTV